MDLDIKCTVTISKTELLEILGDAIEEKFRYAHSSKRPVGNPIRCYTNDSGDTCVCFGEEPAPVDRLPETELLEAPTESIPTIPVTEKSDDF